MLTYHSFRHLDHLGFACLLPEASLAARIGHQNLEVAVLWHCVKSGALAHMIWDNAAASIPRLLQQRRPCMQFSRCSHGCLFL